MQPKENSERSEEKSNSLKTLGLEEQITKNMSYSPQQKKKKVTQACYFPTLKLVTERRPGRFITTFLDLI
jgi:hypothetical protein